MSATDPTKPSDAIPPTEGNPDGAECVTALHANMTGRWLVSTRRTQHIWDLDAYLYCRIPGNSSQRFAHDGEPHPITRVEWWPAVGRRSFVWYDDPQNPDLREQYRISSTIRSITRLTSAHGNAQT